MPKVQAKRLKTVFKKNERSIVNPKVQTRHSKTVSKKTDGSIANDVCYITYVPDSILLLIFHFLDAIDICRASRVCKRWNHISYDVSLWRRVCIKNLKKLRQVTSFVRTRVGLKVQLRDLHISGYYSALHKPEPYALTLSIAPVRRLATQCPSLTSLHLHRINLKNVTFSCFPPTVRELCLFNCDVPFKWFVLADLSDYNTLTNLTLLDISYIRAVRDEDVKCLATHCKSLETLRIAGCYRLTISSLQSPLRRLKNLKEFSVDFFGLTEYSLGGYLPVPMGQEKLVKFEFGSFKTRTPPIDYKLWMTHVVNKMCNLETLVVIDSFLASTETLFTVSELVKHLDQTRLKKLKTFQLQISGFWEDRNLNKLLRKLKNQFGGDGLKFEILDLADKSCNHVTCDRESRDPCDVANENYDS